MTNNITNNITITATEEFELDFEVVERKGVGHPDTLCDILAEKISSAYSRYCLDNFGVVLRHMVDKLSILGGSCEVTFGGGKIIKPFRVLLNGRFTSKFGDEEIPFLDIANLTIKNYLKSIFSHLEEDEIDSIYTVVNNTHSSPGPGVVITDNQSKNERAHFFDVPDKSYLLNHSNFNRANDTSTVVAYTTSSIVEQIALNVEKMLNSISLKTSHPYIGYDIKVMVCRNNKHIKITVCVPLISKFINSKEEYINKLNTVKEIIESEISKIVTAENTFDLFINTRDNLELDDMYLTLTGSATESGDEGVVGRGNRYNGIIPFNRHSTLEACCGKNPIYHVGKIYTAVAKKISEEIYQILNISNVVYISSQMGAPLNNPNFIAINLQKSATIDLELKQQLLALIQNNFDKINNTSLDIIFENLKLY